MVNVFRRSRDVPPHVDDILAKNPKSVWMQLGISNDEAAERLARAGIDVVQDRCLMVELRSTAVSGLYRTCAPQDTMLSDRRQSDRGARRSVQRRRAQNLKQLRTGERRPRRRHANAARSSAGESTSGARRRRTARATRPLVQRHSLGRRIERRRESRNHVETDQRLRLFASGCTETGIVRREPICPRPIESATAGISECRTRAVAGNRVEPLESRATCSSVGNDDSVLRARDGRVQAFVRSLESPPADGRPRRSILSYVRDRGRSRGRASVVDRRDEPACALRARGAESGDAFSAQQLVIFAERQVRRRNPRPD